MTTGTILIRAEESLPNHVAIYARVSSSVQKQDLDRQIARLVTFANSNKWMVSQTVIEIGSGLNGHRPKLMKLLIDPKVKIRLKEETNIKGRVLSATVSREADRWFVSIHVEEERESPVRVQGEVTAIDVGLTCFGVFPCGKKLHAPKPLEKRLKRLKRASKKHSRKLKGSNNRRKSGLTLARLHRKISNTRKDFLHKESTKLAKTKSVIVIEDLDIKGMLRNGKWNRQISDVGWGELRRMLEYKTEWYGSKLVVAPRYFPSSKRCSCCGYVVNHLPLSIRNWQCTNCGVQHDRDVNAACNLMIWSTGSFPGIYACGDTSGGMSESLLAMHL